MKKIILDTNFLLIPGANKVDIFSEIERICVFKYQIIVLDRTISELETLTQTPSKAGINAKLGLDLIKKKKIKVIKTKQGHTDDIIVEIADKDTIVATQDKDLKQRLKDRGIPVIILRSMRYLELKLT